LCRVSWGASGLVGGKFDVGAYETDGIYFIEVDAHGRRLRTERFLIERLGDAVARLYERYADLLPEGPARTRAAATARSVAAMVGPFEAARWAPALAPDLEFVDNRHVSFESGRGAEVYLASLQALIDVAEVSASRVDDILALRPDAVLVRWMNFGTARLGGGPFERLPLFLWVFGPDGLIRRLEFFEGDDDRALARFDELTGTSTAAHVVEDRRRRVQPNAATANAARVEAAMTAGDADSLPGLIADDVEVIDHTTGTTWDHQGALISWRSLLKARDPSFRQEPLAALGASLALCRHTTSASGFAGRTFDVGTYEREEFDVIEVDPKG